MAAICVVCDRSIAVVIDKVTTHGRERGGAQTNV